MFIMSSISVYSNTVYTDTGLIPRYMEIALQLKSSCNYAAQLTKHDIVNNGQYWKSH